MKIEFFVPEIRGKGRPRLTKSGVAFTDAKTRSYENLVKLLALQAMEKAGATVTDKPVKAIINGEIKPAKPDVDNIIKSIFDGCNKIIFKDDVQIYTLTATKSYITNLNRYGVYCIFEWD